LNIAKSTAYNHAVYHVMDDILPWFHLKSVPGVGNHLFKRLLDRFNSPQNVFRSSEKNLLAVDGMTVGRVAAIKHHKIPDRVTAELERLAGSNFRIVTLTDPDYPQLLHRIPDPPPFLYVYGRVDHGADKIAVVGSRNATGYGLQTSRNLSADLAGLGLTIVSGMALGIDTAAHEGALSVNGKTVAVLGSGLERIYPARNRKLFHRIAENGAVISEFSLNSEPEAHHFPVRNRIISGMCLGTVVVEATRKSGSLITARLAAEQNREVFAVPGSVQSFKSVGTHTLIKQGAKLVENIQDILEELPPLPQPAANVRDSGPDENSKTPAALNADEARVYRALGPYGVHIDELARELSMAPARVSSLLLQLELKGLVNQSPGKFFCVSER
jgi:DNA processing protein